MQKKIMIFWGIIVLCFFNYNIYKKEQIKQSKNIIFLELSPIDPRSLIQGDYMRLNYTITNDEKVKEVARLQEKGELVIAPDKNNIAKFIRLYKGEKLNDNEKLLTYHKKYSRVIILPNTFMFQEGYRKFYNKAKYGIFKFKNSKEYLLTGLADADRKEIMPENENM